MQNSQRRRTEEKKTKDSKRGYIKTQKQQKKRKTKKDSLVKEKSQLYRNETKKRYEKKKKRTCGSQFGSNISIKDKRKTGKEKKTNVR
jgi:hypothetical protein